MLCDELAPDSYLTYKAPYGFRALEHVEQAISPAQIKQTTNKWTEDPCRYQQLKLLALCTETISFFCG